MWYFGLVFTLWVLLFAFSLIGRAVALLLPTGLRPHASYYFSPIRIPNPRSPKALGRGTDNRKLGIGFISMEISRNGLGDCLEAKLKPLIAISFIALGTWLVDWTS